MTAYKEKYKDSIDYMLVYCELIKAAQNRSTIGYQDVAAIMGLPMTGNHMARETGQMLGEISQNEHARGRPMLSALVVRVDGSPGPGFFVLARDLGKLKDGTKEDEKRFWQGERDAVFKTWRRPNKT